MTATPPGSMFTSERGKAEAQLIAGYMLSANSHYLEAYQMNEPAKSCSGCKETKPTTQFSRNRGCKDGLDSRCKACRKGYAQSSAGIAAYARYAQTPKGRARRRRGSQSQAGRAGNARYKQSPKGRAAAQRNYANMRTLYPEKIRARAAVGNAIVAGRLIPQPCEVCWAHPYSPGGRRLVHGHHDDYSKLLEVRWLCIKHHAKHHKGEA